MKKNILILFVLFPFLIFGGNAIWHWHKNIVFNPDDLETLARSNFTEIFVNSGSFYLFSTDHKKVPEFSGLEFDDNFYYVKDILNNFNIHLVFTFESWGKHTFYSDFMKKDPNSTNFILSIIKNQIKQFEDRGVKIDGIQIDLEGIDIDLDYYSELLDAIREKFPDKLLSITPMVGWLSKKEFKPILKNIDFYVPMVYDYQRGKKLSNDTRITDINWIVKVVRNCEKLEKPYYIGLPSYYYRIFYNEKNHRINSWTFVGYEELSENKAFELVKTRKNYSLWDKKMFNGDNISIFRVKKPIFYKYYYLPRGSHLLYNIITPEGLKMYVDAVNFQKPKYIKGISIFRYTKAKEPYLIKTSYFPYIFSNQSLIPKGEAKFYLEKNNDENLILYTTLKNIGNCESLVEKNGVQFLIKLKGAKIKSVVKNNFDNYDFYYDSENNISYLTFTEKFLDLDEEVASGPIMLNKIGEGAINIQYQIWIKKPDGNYFGINLTKWKDVKLNEKDN
jgi:hypothetical protein